ncbi:MAG: nucleotide 5'-monophosphate nucleosidase PpnN [Candidatus Symbiodolus clandestinus]
MITLGPVGPLKQLSGWELQQCQQRLQGEHAQLFHQCALAVLHSGHQMDNQQQLLSCYPDFSIQLLPKHSELHLRLLNPPPHALVEGQLIHSLHAHLFAVVRDLLLGPPELAEPVPSMTDPSLASQQITHQIFAQLRHAQVVTEQLPTPLIVCWGGHAIQATEYRYAQQVGYELGLRGLQVATGCGPGAMEAPMKGAVRGHARQWYKNSRLIGLTEPMIIAAEPPNAFVNQLVILADIEKRLEAFVRLARGIIIFPGGPGTAEELLYLLAILMHADNQHQRLPVILTGPRESAAYWQPLEQFIQEALGLEAQHYYQLIVDDAQGVAQSLKQLIEPSDRSSQPLAFNASLVIPYALQQPFHPTHAAMAQLTVNRQQSASERAILLRQLFSGIVAGNIRQESIQAVAEQGPFRLQGDHALMQAIDRLLNAFIQQQRMKLPGSTYVPCYEIAS